MSTSKLIIWTVGTGLDCIVHFCMNTVSAYAGASKGTARYIHLCGQACVCCGSVYIGKAQQAWLLNDPMNWNQKQTG